MVSELISEFESYHSITVPQWWDSGRKLLATLLTARSVTKSALRGISPSVLNNEPIFGMVFHLFERTYEHVAASLVCFATANAATAEVASRVAIESSVNIRFILCGDRNSLALAWLRDYISQDTKQINEWEKLIQSLTTNEKAVHAPRIATRNHISTSANILR